jgi:hypothetical protein
MIRMHALNPRGMPHQTGMTPLSLGTICMHCFEVLGAPKTRAHQLALQARHNCPEKQLARQPATPVPFS